jgi:PAS domain-containing protein
LFAGNTSFPHLANRVRKNHSMQNQSFRAALIYLVVGVLWTIITNWLVYEFLPNSNNPLWFFIRSMVFVVLSTVGVYYVFKVHYRHYHAAERKYEQLFQNYPQPIWIYDTDTYRFLKLNKATLDQYGYTAAEFSRLTLLDLFPESKQDLCSRRSNQSNTGISQMES